MPSKNFDRLFGQLAKAEDRFLKSEFLAPVVRGGEVRVRVASVICRLRVSPADFEGFGVFRPISHSSAELVRPANLAEQRRYLELFPIVRLILSSAGEGHWLAAAAHWGDRRFRIEGLAPVRLVEEAQAFDVVRARFDGGNFWFDELEPSRDPATAAWLRQALHCLVDPNLLDRPGLTPEERAVYAIHYFQREEVRKQLEADRIDERLRAALAHAGAELVDYLERRDSFRVTYTVGGRQHVSAVRKDDLRVEMAGICLSGQDRYFDLASLVGVLQEAEGGVLRIGRENQGMEEDDYWRVHPPGE
jgi:hypothetical protein